MLDCKLKVKVGEKFLNRIASIIDYYNSIILINNHMC